MDRKELYIQHVKTVGDDINGVWGVLLLLRGPSLFVRDGRGGGYRGSHRTSQFGI